MLILIGGLSVSALFDRDFKWFAGALPMTLGGLGLLWYRFGARWGRMRVMIGTLDWATTFFLVGVFVLVGAVEKSGWLETLARGISTAAGDSALSAYLLIVGLAVTVSAFVDNVPFLLAMIPVTRTVAERLGVNMPLLMFGLLVGTCLGGNITPIGASANIVTMGILRKTGHHVSFREFMAIGIPFTLAAVVAASVLLWMIWV
jgi:Na+/H+ antiporter NhaD/arsenite permease-like protein